MGTLNVKLYRALSPLPEARLERMLHLLHRRRTFYAQFTPLLFYDGKTRAQMHHDDRIHLVVAALDELCTAREGGMGFDSVDITAEASFWRPYGFNGESRRTIARLMDAYALHLDVPIRCT